MKKQFIDMHTRLYNRLLRTAVPLVIFLDNATLRGAEASEKVLDKILSSRNLKILGVYDNTCPDNWLYDDLLWADDNWGKK